MYLKKSVKIGDSELSIEVGRMAKQADGAVVVRYGDTMLLVTAVSAKEKKDDETPAGFLTGTLVVEYQSVALPVWITNSMMFTRGSPDFRTC